VRSGELHHASLLLIAVEVKEVQARTRLFTLADYQTTCKTYSRHLVSQRKMTARSVVNSAPVSNCHDVTACLGGGVSPVISGQVPHRVKSAIESRIARSELAMIGVSYVTHRHDMPVSTPAGTGVARIIAARR